PRMRRVLRLLSPALVPPESLANSLTASLDPWDRILPRLSFSEDCWRARCHCPVTVFMVPDLLDLVSSQQLLSIQDETHQDDARRSDPWPRRSGRPSGRSWLRGLVSLHGSCRHALTGGCNECQETRKPSSPT